MPYRDFVVEGGQCPGKSSGGVSMNQHQVRGGLLQHSVHAVQTLGGDGGQGLAGLHDVQIVVGL